MRFISYAQEFEDLILYGVLCDINEGFYVDVGANDPILFNVTKAFYDRGWHGINIEPLNSQCEMLDTERQRDINLCVGCGESEAELYLTDAGMTSTFSEKIVSENGLKNNHKYIKKIMTLTQIYKQYCKENQTVHFCKIDVEGFEKKVLNGIDWSIFRPWIYVIEATKVGTYIPCYDEWEDILLNNGYVHAYSDPLNRYYVDCRKEHLLERFNNLKHFVEKIKIDRVIMKEVDKSQFLERL